MSPTPQIQLPERPAPEHPGPEQPGRGLVAQAILDRLERHPEHVFAVECGRDGRRQVDGRRLAGLIAAHRRLLRQAGLRRGDRCALLGANSIDWIAADIALLAEGVVAVPLYHRQRPEELAAILRDVDPALLLTDSTELIDELDRAGAPRVATHLLPDAAGDSRAGRQTPEPAVALAPDDPVTIIYTSGTSGEPKGVVLVARNLEFMVAATAGELDALTGGREAEPVFHYLPFCFAGSWIMLLISLLRRSTLTLNVDPARLAEDLTAARPLYFQNVPMLLERLREGIEQALRERGGAIEAIWRAASSAGAARAEGRRPTAKQSLGLAMARAFVFPSIRRRLGGTVRWLICGSAPLAASTQVFFNTLGIPVLQVYGLTETTAICTMDVPGEAVPGRVGHAVPGVEMRLGEDDEILVRGPNVFDRYWERPQATEAAFADGWFRTGDRGELDAAGNWRILGRIKDLIVLASGHNVAPEPIEAEIEQHLPGAEQVLVIGDGRPHLGIIVTGAVDSEHLERALDAFNTGASHYRKVRCSMVLEEPFTSASGLVTPNGKLRRRAVCDAMAERIEALYAGEEVMA